VEGVGCGGFDGEGADVEMGFLRWPDWTAPLVAFVALGLGLLEEVVWRSGEVVG
jgi:hypothetical protein